MFGSGTLSVAQDAAPGKSRLAQKTQQFTRRGKKEERQRRRALIPVRHLGDADHRMKTNFSLLLLLLVLGGAGSIAVAQSPGTFTATGSMTAARSRHTATLLNNGKVLITGGGRLASAELYDPATETFTPTGDMTTPRWLHTATLLSDGKVLIAGGYTGDPIHPMPSASAEIYEPDTGTFSRTGDMNQGRTGHTANLLANGTVLITGGSFGAWPVLADAEVYDADTGTFAAAAAYASGAVTCDFCPPDVLLADGRVLFDQVQPAQVYDPATGTFNPTGAMVYPAHTAATLLRNGNVLLTGGETDFGRSASAELYDPEAGTFSASSNMASRRVWHSSTLLADGSVLIAGGETDNVVEGGSYFGGSVATAEVYDSARGVFTPTGSMTRSRELHTATLLRDGRVLIAGGALASAELYTPASSIPVGSWVTIISKNSGKCLDVSGGPSATDPGTPLIQWSCWGGSNQSFQLTPVADGFEITAQNSGLQLDVAGISTDDGAAVIQWPYWGGPNEIWRVAPTGDGYFTLSPLHSGKCLDVTGISVDDGATVQQWTCWGGDNQKWSFVPVR
jgi:hypothetical protein